MIRYPNAIPPARIPCPECNGRGYHSNERGTEWDCERCEGRGYLKQRPRSFRDLEMAR